MTIDAARLRSETSVTSGYPLTDFCNTVPSSKQHATLNHDMEWSGR